MKEAMVARAQKRKWIDLVAGLLVGAATQPLALLAGPDTGLALLPASTDRSEQTAAQLGGGSSRARMALNAAIDAERLGDLDTAAAKYQEAQARVNDLSADEQRELNRRLAANALALRARREAHEQLGLAESAIQHGRPADAAALIKKITANELYLSPADRQRFQILCQRIHVPSGASSSTNMNAAGLAHDKIRLARAELSKSDLEAAETLAREVDQLHITFAPQEDSPRKVFEDLDKARRDAKTLLLASRASLQRGSLDRAEQYARAAEQLASPFTFMMGDSPGRVLKEIQSARAKAPANDRLPAKGMNASDRSAGALTKQSANTDKARMLVQQGRQALVRGDVVQARKCAEQASTLNADLQWSEDNPARLLEDITRTAGGSSASKTGKTPEGNAVTTIAPIKTKEEALTLLRQGREQLAKGELEQANKTAARLRGARHIHWGLFFEDTPDRFQADVDNARLQRNKQQSIELLAEARRRYEKKDYDGAEKLAYEARSKHGPYSIWDLGDRPNKVLADVQAARQKERVVKLPDPPTAQRQVADLSRGPLAQPGSNTTTPNTNGSATPPMPPADTNITTASFNASQTAKVNEARQILKEARLALNSGAVMQARLLADRARDMHVVLNAPGDDSPENIYRDIERVSQRPQGSSAAQSMQASASSPKTGSPYLSSPPVDDGRMKAASDNLVAQTRARRLMAEARSLQQQNRLLEARDKIDEARRLGVTFRPDEETPSVVYQQLAFQARQRIDSLVHHAGETLRYGTQAPMARCKDAEYDLSQARQLALAFGLDIHPIDATMRMVDQLRTTGNTMLVSSESRATSSEYSQQGSQNAGLRTQDASQLLDQARLELRSGQTANARHFAEEAIKLGAGEGGLAVLRSVDAEEDAQLRRRANRTFDEVIQAYLHRDYRRASLILASVDTTKLDEQRRGRLREMLNTPEMQPNARGSAIALTAAQEVSSPGMGTTGHSQPSMSTLPGGDTGHARATDDPGQSLLDRTRAMREVKFQQLRNEGLTIQTQALERFRTGQTDTAVEMLQDYLDRLGNEQLDASQLSMLRRPIDSRLQQFQLLKAQADLANNRFDERSRQVKSDITKAKSAEQVKQKNIAQLMKQYNDLFQQAKYPEAEMVALRVKELDPDNPMATAAMTMAKYQRNHSESQSDKERKEDLFLGAMHDTDDLGERGVIEKGLVFTQDEKRREQIRSRKSLEGLPLQRKSAEELNIERRLMELTSLSYTNQPLGDIINDIRGEKGINIFVDTPALADKGIQLESPVNIKVDNIALKSALKLLLSYVHLTYIISDDVLKITTEDQARGKLEPKVYQVADLVIAVENFGQVGVTPDANLGMVNVNQAMMPNSPMSGMTAMQGGQQVGAPANGSMSSTNGNFATDMSNGGVQVTKQRPQTHEDMLIKLITSTIQPRSWAEQGGPGTIEFHPLTLSLTINQTPDIQDQVQDLLNALRRLIDQEVAVEVKFISISEDFFERIGVNFNLNFVNNSREALQVQPQLTSGQFAQPGFINAFNPGNLISGLTPAGTLTNDLNIPINQLTYPQAIPPFGGYPGIPGFGGLTMGLAFLSDIQVFLFMEAVAGDTRANVMQAPKLTLFNGQTSLIAINDFQFFTVGVQVLNGGFGQLIYNPVTTLIPLNITMTINAVISGDRRFVRMSLAPSLVNIVNGEVNLFPVVTPIFPLFDGTATGQPVVFTQFVQQPHLTRVTINTTVAVPDGGTVLMGGLKRLSEGRNEYGPPVLSKIPYLSRLFRNIGYGRSAESLLIMVTPRILIQAEEEVTQTGYSPPPAIAP
jgi:type II secretory pathway component GspD/PulD (secretin)